MNPIVEKLWNQAAQENDSWAAQCAFIEKLVELVVWETINVSDHIEGINNILTHFGIKYEQPMV
jgi:hypothetical protein